MPADDDKSGLPEDLILTQPIDPAELMFGPYVPHPAAVTRRYPRYLGRYHYDGQHRKPAKGEPST